MNVLASRLAYKGFTRSGGNERNMIGKVEIASGFTASGAALATAGVNFEPNFGDGSYADAGDHHEEEEVGPQTATTFTQTITADRATNQQYIDGGVWKGDNQKYTFQKDSTINVTGGEVDGVNTNGKGLVINAQDHNLTMNIEGSGQVSGIQNTANRINLTAGKTTMHITNTGESANKRAYGIWQNADSADASVQVHGMLDMDLHGLEQTFGINLAKNGEIRVDGLKYHGNGQKNYALVNTGGGTVFVNTDKKHEVQLEGDVYTKLIDARLPIIVLNLTTPTSKWHGVHLYEGTINDPERLNPSVLDVRVTHGGTWENHRISQSATTEYQGSRLMHLYGGKEKGEAGVVIQRDSQPISVEEYSGHTTFLLPHQAATPTDFSAVGDIQILTALPDSSITMRTDDSGITISNSEQVTQVLDALARKLVYYGFTKEGGKERNLVGTVEIASGLTASGAALRYGDIIFRNQDGAGSYEPPFEAKPGATSPIIRSEKLTADRNAHGDLDHTSLVGEFGYTSHDTVAAMYNSQEKKPMTVDAAGHAIKLVVDDEDVVNENVYVAGLLGVHFSKMQVINMDPQKPIHIKVKHEFNNVIGVNIQKGANVSIDGGIVIDQLYSTYSATAIEASGQNTQFLLKGDFSANDIMKGFNFDRLKTGIDITSGVSRFEIQGNTLLKGLGTGIRVSDSRNVRFGGLDLEAIPGEGTRNRAITVNTAELSINMNPENTAPGDKTVKISGDIEADNSNSTSVNIGLKGADSFWTGYKGNAREYHETGGVNLWISDGATWTHKRMAGAHDGDLPSTLRSLHGGADATHRGVIKQESTLGITAADYSGHELFLFEHEDATPTVMKGGNITIEKAAAGSEVTLRTKNNGITMGDTAQVTSVLNALANKLFYKEYTTGQRNLTGTVEIAEGLTSSAAVAKSGAIKFQETDGMGTYVEEAPPAPPEPPEPPAPAKKTPITGVAEKDTYWTGAKIRQDNGHYVFTQDDQITLDATENSGVDGVRNYPIYVLKNITIDAGTHNLTLESLNAKKSDARAIFFKSAKKLDITAGKLLLRASASGKTSKKLTSKAYGLYYKGENKATFRMHGNLGLDMVQLNDHWSADLGWAHLFHYANGDNFERGYYPKDKATFGLNYDNAKWHAGLNGFYFIRRPSTQERDRKYKGWPHDKYAVINLNLAYSPNKSTTVYMKVENLFDVLWAEHTDVIHNHAPETWYSMPGRAWTMGVQYRF